MLGPIGSEYFHITKWAGETTVWPFSRFVALIASRALDLVRSDQIEMFPLFPWRGWWLLVLYRDSIYVQIVLLKVEPLASLKHVAHCDLRCCRRDCPVFVVGDRQISLATLPTTTQTKSQCPRVRDVSPISKLA